MATYSGTVTTGIVLTNPATQNPATVTATGNISNTSPTGDAVYGNNLAAWTLSNYGTVIATADFRNGVFFSNGGLVGNATGGLIAGPTAVQIVGAEGTVLNAGTLAATAASGYGVRLEAGGAVSNIGGTGGSALILGGNIGVLLLNGGAVNNGVSGSAAATITGATYGVRAVNVAGTAANYGTIIGSAAGIFFYNSGDVTNAANAVVAGSNLGIEIRTGIGSVDNSGTVEAGNFAVRIYAGSVTNRQGGALAGGIGGAAALELATVANYGTIIGSGPTSGYGAVLGNGGVVVNGSTEVGDALIAGTARGVQIYDAVGTVTNFGTIAASITYAAAVNLQYGGSVVNQLGGLLIGGGQGIYFGTSAAGTVTNAGTVAGTYASGTGILLGVGGSIANSGLVSGGAYGVNAGTTIIDNSGTIVGGGVGIRLAGGTVINSGSIGGGGGTAIYFGGAGDDRLVLRAGFGFTGGINAGGGNDTLELAGTAGAPVTVDYNTLGLTAFENVAFGVGNNATLQVSNSYGTLGVTVSGFDHTTETIDLTGIGADGTITNFDTLGDRVTITGSGGNLTLQFDSIDGMNFTTAPDGFGGTALIACFLRGTLIRTETGEVPVEALAIGDKVVTASGAARPVKWIGRRAYDPRFVAGNRNVLPVRIEAGALAHGVPARDLYVSPEHALYIRDVLVPAQLLVNDATITQPEAAGSIEYFHLELDTHDVILADGAPAETFVDCDNRFMFQNGREFAELYPLDASPRWEFCAPRIAEGSPELAAIRTTVLARAKVFGRFTADPGLHLIVDGEIVKPQLVTNERDYRFLIPAGSRSVAIASRSIVPLKMLQARSDERRLGVAVERIALRGDGLGIEIGPDCAGLTDGFHEPESGVRWTDGRGRLPDGLLASFAGDFTIDVRLAETDLRYGVDTPPHAAEPRYDTGAAEASLPPRGAVPTPSRNSA